MTAIRRTLRIPQALDRAIHSELAVRGAPSWSGGVHGLMEEAIRMSRVPGIFFVHRRGERRAAIAFCGLEVWEVIAAWQEAQEDWSVLRRAYPELLAEQLQTALAYYRAYPDEIDARLALEAFWTPARVAEVMPFTQRTGASAPEPS